MASLFMIFLCILYFCSYHSKDCKCINFSYNYIEVYFHIIPPFSYMYMHMHMNLSADGYSYSAQQQQPGQSDAPPPPGPTGAGQTSGGVVGRQGRMQFEEEEDDSGEEQSESEESEELEDGPHATLSGYVGLPVLSW